MSIPLPRPRRLQTHLQTGVWRHFYSTQVQNCAYQLVCAHLPSTENESTKRGKPIHVVSISFNIHFAPIDAFRTLTWNSFGRILFYLAVSQTKNKMDDRLPPVVPTLDERRYHLLIAHHLRAGERQAHRLPERTSKSRWDYPPASWFLRNIGKRHIRGRSPLHHSHFHSRDYHFNNADNFNGEPHGWDTYLGDNIQHHLLRWTHRHLPDRCLYGEEVPIWYQFESWWIHPSSSLNDLTVSSSCQTYLFTPTLFTFSHFPQLRDNLIQSWWSQ